jgi:regulatory protein
MVLPQLSLKGRALRHLAAREHSRAELARKLAAHAEDPAEIERTLDALQALGYLSEERVAASLVHRRAAKLGTARIQQELQGKGLDAELVASTVETLRQSEAARAFEAWQRKFGEVAAQPREQARQMRFLAGRGFAPEVFRRVVRGDYRPEADEAAAD